VRGDARRPSATLGDTNDAAAGRRSPGCGTARSAALTPDGPNSTAGLGPARPTGRAGRPSRPRRTQTSRTGPAATDRSDDRPVRRPAGQTSTCTGPPALFALPERSSRASTAPPALISATM